MKGASLVPHSKSHGGTHRSSRRSNHDSVPSPISGPRFFESPKPSSSNNSNAASVPLPGGPGVGVGVGIATSAQPSSPADLDGSSSPRPPVNTSPQAAEPGAVVKAEGGQDDKNSSAKTLAQRIWRIVKAVLLHSKLNLLLVFVPVGIAVNEVGGMSPGLVFAMNAIAIVPLAGLLSFATESVARRLGDSLGALLNVTFGNAVELIIL